MVDIPRLISAKQRREQERWLMTLNTLIAANNRAMEQSDYKSFVARLTPAETNKAAETFDRDAFERLRASTLRGGNKAN